MKRRLEHIGFYTLSDKRARESSVTSKMMRGEMIITENCNFTSLFMGIEKKKSCLIMK
jgi:hypothetical protein